MENTITILMVLDKVLSFVNEDLAKEAAALLALQDAETRDLIEFEPSRFDQVLFEQMRVQYRKQAYDDVISLYENRFGKKIFKFINSEVKTSCLNLTVTDNPNELFWNAIGKMTNVEFMNFWNSICTDANRSEIHMTSDNEFEAGLGKFSREQLTFELSKIWKNITVNRATYLNLACGTQEFSLNRSCYSKPYRTW